MEIAYNLATNGAAASQKQNHDLAIDYYSKAIAIDTNYAYAYFARAQEYYGKSDFSTSLKDLNEAIRIGPEPQFYLLRAAVFSRLHKTDDAINNDSEAIRLKPSYADAYVSRANEYVFKGAYDKALEDYDAAIQTKPSIPHVFAMRANAYRLNGDYERAVVDCNIAIKIDPRDASVYAVRGLVFFTYGNYTNAIADFQKAISQDMNCTVAYNNLAWLLCVCPQKELRDGRKALQYARKACELQFWSDPYSLGTLAAAFAEVGSFDEAVKWETKAIKIGFPPKDSEQAQMIFKLYKKHQPYYEKPKMSANSTRQP